MKKPPQTPILITGVEVLAITVGIAVVLGIAYYLGWWTGVLNYVP